MWERIYDYAAKLLRLKEQTDQNTSDIKEIRDELEALTEAVRHLAYEVRRTQDKAETDKETLILRLENLLLLEPATTEARELVAA